MVRRRKQQDGPEAARSPLLSIRLDPLLWERLHKIAAQQARSANELVMEIARDSLAIAIQVYIEEFCRARRHDPE